ncbi:MAG TPA: hypothetical protein VIH57_12820 [Bacteroidales bacterium]
MENGQHIIDEISRLNKKADQTRSMHSAIMQKLKRWQVLLTLYVTIGSATTAMLTFVQLEHLSFIIIGCLSASIFITGLLPSALDLSKKITERDVAIKLWGNWIRDAQNFTNIRIKELNLEEAVKQEEKLIETYKEVINTTIDIPDRLFLKLKQRHKQKVAISIELDKNPFESLKSIKKRLKSG